MALMKINVSCYMTKLMLDLCPPVEKWFPHHLCWLSRNITFCFYRCYLFLLLTL